MSWWLRLPVHESGSIAKILPDFVFKASCKFLRSLAKNGRCKGSEWIFCCLPLRFLILVFSHFAYCSRTKATKTKMAGLPKPMHAASCLRSPHLCRLCEKLLATNARMTFCLLLLPSATYLSVFAVFLIIQ